VGSAAAQRHGAGRRRFVVSGPAGLKGIQMVIERLSKVNS